MRRLSDWHLVDSGFSRILRRMFGVLLIASTVPASAQDRGASALGTPPPAARASSSATAAAQPDANASLDDLPSLFAPIWNTVQIGGRLSSISGDAARYQRYEDLRNGLLVTNARLQRGTADWNATAGADNVGYRDQRYFGSYERTGRFTITGLWDEIPQFYSADTQTAFTSGGAGVLVLPDSAQQVGRNTAYLNISPQFDLRERRDIGSFRIGATPTTSLDITGGFQTTRHSGELPWGASFGFSNDAEVALPYQSRTNDADLGVSWTNQRAMLRAGYSGSWFDNQDETLVWDNPLVLNDSAAAPGRGRTALWPSNSMQTLSTAGYMKLARRTQVTGSLAFGWWNNNEPLLPFTINSALAQIPLPRATAEAAAHTVATNISMVSRPKDDWQTKVRFRRYDYNNETPPTSITQYVAYDDAVSTTPTGGPDLYAHSRNTFDADATWTKLNPLALTVGYTNNHNGYDARTFESTNENVLRLMADAVGTQWATFRARYEYGSRMGSGLNEQQLVAIGEHPEMRYYDLADRTRNQFTGQIDLVPSDALTVSVSGSIGSDDYHDSYFGLQNTDFRTLSLGADYTLPRGVIVGGTYNRERYSGFQQSRSANPDATFNDPNRNWTMDTAETVDYFSIHIQPPRFGRTEARFSYEYAHARGDFVYNVGPALPPPSQLPETFNKLQDLRIDIRHRLNRRWAANINYRYEPLSIFDFAFDPSVIDGIAQGNSLVLGYTYRPYTAHTVIFGAMYYW